MDAGFQRLELLIKNRCGGGGPRPPQSGFSGVALDHHSQAQAVMKIQAPVVSILESSFFFFFQVL